MEERTMAKDPGHVQSPRPYAPQSIHNVRYVLKPSSAGNLRIVEQRVPDYELK